MASIHNQMETLNDSHDDAARAGDYRTYFRVVVENGKTFSECLVENCSKKRLAGKQKNNCERHLRLIHKMVNFMAQKTMTTDAEITLKIKMSPATIYRSWVERVAVNGRTIGCMEDSGSKLLTDPLLKAFELAGVRVDVSIPTLKTYLDKYAEEVKSKIREEVKDTIVHVKLDLARRLRRSILGVNIQFMKNDKIVVRTLCMKETNSSHTGEYICALVMDALDSFGIKYSQVHTITSDNGANVLKAGELFCGAQSIDFLNQSLSDLELDELFRPLNVDDETEDSSNDKESEEADAIEANVNSAISLLAAKTEIMTVIRCAAHILQLIVTIALSKTDYAKKLIKKCRRIVKELFKAAMAKLLKQQNRKAPIIDCATRWSSTYYMLERLLELKDFIVSVESFMPAGCKMTENDWRTLEAILCILKFFESLTKKLQAVQYTVSDFYAAWTELKIEMENMAGIELVDNILTEMRHREKDLLENDVVYGCVYLDPRFKILLNAGNIFWSANTRYINI